MVNEDDYSSFIKAKYHDVILWVKLQAPLGLVTEWTSSGEQPFTLMDTVVLCI